MAINSISNEIILADNVAKAVNRNRPNEIWPVRNVSISVVKGETVVLKGPSGSGKTSLLSIIGCMSRPTTGRMIVNGKDVAKLPEPFLNEIRRKTFGFIFQQFNLIPGISVQENIMLPLYPSSSSLTTIKHAALEVMKSLGLTEKRHFEVQGLSGGEQQRVAIARSLINEPEIILADEPTAHLDTKLSMDLIDIFRTLKAKGKTLIIATHDPLVYSQDLIDRAISMRDGTVSDEMTVL